MKSTLMAAVVALATLAAAPAFAVKQHGNIDTNGPSLNGLAINGLKLNGMGVNGMGVNGFVLNGLAINGTEARGTNEGGTLTFRAVTLADGTVVVLN